MRPSVIAAAVCVACGAPKAGPADDAGPSADAQADVSAASGCAPISGTAPFAVTVSGTAEPIGDARAPAGGSATLYFPRGRVAGGEVVTVVGRFRHDHLAIARSTLDATLSAPISAHDPDCGGGVKGTLVGPAGGIDAIVSVNLGAPSDALDIVRGRAILCATGSVTKEPSFTSSPTSVARIDAIVLRTSLPVDLPSIATISVTGDSIIPVTVREDDGAIRIQPAGAWPAVSQLSLDLTGVRDALGRALPKLAPIKVPNATESIVDPTFAALPSERAMLASEPGSIVDGKLVFAPAADSFHLQLRVGGDSAAKKIRLRHRAVCDESSRMYATVVSADGKRADASVECAKTVADQRIVLSGTPPWTLYVVVWSSLRAPCSHGFSSVAPGYELDELEFEK